MLTAAGAVTDRSNPWARAATFTGNGPFALAEWRPDAFLRATRNPHYWDAAQVQLNAIVFYPTENPDNEERNFRAGQVHLDCTRVRFEAGARRGGFASIPLEGGAFELVADALLTSIGEGIHRFEIGRAHV